MLLMDPSGAYSADRAAALSGVPMSTVHYWSRKGWLVPSVSAERTKLWSYADLLELRMIDWLRKDKGEPVEHEIPRSRMKQIREAKARLVDFDLRLFQDGTSTVAVTRAGEVIICRQGVVPHDSQGQQLTDYVDLIQPEAGRIHLLRPRKTIRIVPGKLSGAPHVQETRVETEALHALKVSGYDPTGIRSLYPYLSLEAVGEAIDLEEDLLSRAA
jgi:uncharacterized protein (DUF433 family)